MATEGRRPLTVVSADAAEAKRRMVKNSVSLLVMRLVVPVFSVLLIMIVARKLGTSGLGRYTLAFTFLYFFNTIAPLGIEAIITRDGARDRESVGRLLGSALWLGTAAALAVTAVSVGIVTLLLDYDSATRTAILIVSLAILPCTVQAYLDAAAIAIERMELVTLAALVESVTKALVGIAALYAGYGLSAVLLAAVGGRILACMTLFRPLRLAGISLRISPDSNTARYLLRSAPTFLLIGVFAVLYWRIDIFMLSKMRAVGDVGLYGAAWRLLELGMAVPQSLCLAVYPQLANVALVDARRFADLGGRTLTYLLVISLPLAACGAAVSRPLLTFFYGEDFEAAAGTLAVLMWTVVPYAWVRFHACVLVATNRQGVDLALNATMTLLNVVLNLVLIPRYSYFGAAVATLVSIVLYGLAQHIYIRLSLREFDAKPAWRPALFAGAALATTWAWCLRDVSVIASAFGAVVVYAGTLLATGFVTMADLRLLGFFGARYSHG